MAEAILTLPDGRKVKLTGPDRESIMQQAQSLPQIVPNGAARPMPTEQFTSAQLPGLNQRLSTVGGSNEGALEAFARSGAEDITAMIANVPNVLANTVRRVPAQLGITGPKGGLAATDRRSLGDLVAPTSRTVPSLADPVIPTPSGERIIAGAETVLEAPVAALQGQDVNLSEMLGKNLADAEQLAQEHPLADTLGSGTALALGRSQVARSRAPQMTAMREAAAAEAKERLARIPSHIREQLNDVISDRVIPTLREYGVMTRRGLRKAGETGLEGATLAVLNQGDPETMFWFGAGTQAAGSLGLTIATKPVKGLAPFVLGTYLASEMFKAVAPGEQNFFESKDFAIQKAVAALTIGTAAGLAGLGSIRNKWAEKLPATFDAITSVPRGALLARLQELTKNRKLENDLPLEVMEAIYRDPEIFNANVRNSLSRAFMSKKEGAFTKEVERLSKESKAFREWLDSRRQ